MRTNIRDYINIGIVHFMAFPDNTQEAKTINSIIKDPYFDFIEVKEIKDKSVVKNLLNSKIGIGYSSQPVILEQHLNLNSLDENERRNSVETLKVHIDNAVNLKASGFGIMSGKFETNKINEHMLQLEKSLNELCQYSYSKSKSMNILLEVFDYDIDKKVLIGPVHLSHEIAKKVCGNNINFGLMVDLSHIPMIHETIEESLRPIKDYIKHAHVGNTVIKDPSFEAYGDLHPRFGFPNSENDVDEVTLYLKTLFDLGYFSEKKKSILSFEVKPFGEEDPEVVIVNAKRVLDQAWRNLNL